MLIVINLQPRGGCLCPVMCEVGSGTSTPTLVDELIASKFEALQGSSFYHEKIITRVGLT
jgi:hypothetical protein